ncbi:MULTISPECIES: cbb3-type cytochrome c oxidase N-terminal domain-containing protein [Sphingobacterium]|uniref:cbb3-type cytochrome c oxidase N-terminal domain-containing protein n=1 Tax=Sphingobacterium TaxID=28453 RepID=UPI001042A136|nr:MULTISPECIES: cbb3-type cytochrome c oxidase N-terminal domain-containing protein [Sphingobacterium]MCW2260907.1 cytochrome c oxidase cbb3-type subunit 3 [Sphingobacterium kitahiroshimense]TCR09205.1 cytochrome c oxidase cbb3-type subunit 3 [Sphingobacterium sp. JUb78]
MSLFLNTTVVNAETWSISSGNIYQNILIIVLIVVMLALLASALMVNKAIRSILRITMPEILKEEQVTKIRKKESRKASWNKLLGLRPISEEKDLIIDHEYDGIKELDNPIPIWFNALFYSTMTFAVVYILIYHVFGWGLNQNQEYAQEMEKAEIAKQEYLAQAANLIDESSVVYDESKVAAGHAVFQANCVACHGGAGEGGIGPNLADRFWLHGGEIKDIFKTVKYGVPDKGMVPWEQTLTPGQIAEVSSYIISIRDTKPANPKEPQGTEVTYATADAKATIADSTKVQ